MTRMPTLKRPSLSVMFLKGKDSPHKSDWSEACVVTHDRKYMLYSVRDMDLEYMKERNAEGMVFEGPDFQ